MWLRSLTPLTLTAFSSLPVLAAAQQAPPVEVSVCELAKSPQLFDGKSVRVRSELNVSFEDFTLAHPDCSKDQWIWLAFGGDVPGIVDSTANDNIRQPGVDLRIKGVAYQIKKDESFRRLYALITARQGDKPEYQATATLTGVFLAGHEGKLANGSTNFSGYGHLGCCSLLVITEVSNAESVPEADLDLKGVVVGPNEKPMQGIIVLNDILGGEPPERQRVSTNDKGEFGFSNSGQELRIEDPNYRPLGLHVQPGGNPIRVKLEEAKLSDWIIPNCAEGDRGHRVGFSVFFALPKTMTSGPFNDEAEESIFVFPRGSEMPFAEMFITKIKEQVVGKPESPDSRWIKDGAGNLLGIDSKWTADGYWERTIFFSGHENYRYVTRSAARRRAYDAIIDSACIVKH